MKYINKTHFLILTTTLTLLFSFLLSYAQNTSRNIANSVVRLHIVANSDSDEDQALKFAVRDRLLKDASSIFQNAKTPNDALCSASENIDLITQIAEDEIKAHGFNYDTTVKIGFFSFPTKTYDNIMLPSGKYNAVRVEIGSGKGKNWWCVMYPPLCFTEGIVSISEESRQKLKSSIPDEEYALITGQSKGAIPVEIKFKVVEIFQKILE